MENTKSAPATTSVHAVRGSVYSLDVDIQRRAPLHGCFLEGTDILLESGENKKVEELLSFDPVNPGMADTLLSVDGTKVFIAAKFTGNRTSNYVELKARPTSSLHSSKLLEVTVSSTHTFAVGFSRIVQAAYLSKGQSVRTIYGEALVEEASFSESNQMVWNVYLASEQFVKEAMSEIGNDAERLLACLFNSSLGLTAKQHLLFGNGFLSGDLYLQTYADEISCRGISFNDLR